MIYNIAVFGSCASRDNFYSGINPDYKKYFNCSISSQRGSIISLMQESVSFKNQDIQILPENRVNKAGTQFINQDLTKNFLAEVKKFKPDYILIDNYFEVIFGIIKYENCFITNNYWDLPKTKFHTEIKPYTKINMYNDPNTYLKLYKENMGLFLDYIQKESPNSQIILNPVRLGYKILKDDNKIEVNKNLEEQIETIYNSFFVYYDDFSKEELEECEIGLIPKDWKLMSLGEVTTKIKEKVGSDDYKVFSAVNTGNLILSEEYFDKQVYSKNIEKYIVVKQKEFAYNPARINIGSIGRNDFNYDGCVSPVYVAFKVEEGYENFMNMYIKSNRFNQWVVTLSSGSVRQTLNYADFSIIKIAYPPKDLVNKFNKVYDNYYEVINYNNSVISNLENIRDTLLPKLMSGEIDVSKINCDLELKYNYMKYLFNQIHTPMSKSVV